MCCINLHVFISFLHYSISVSSVLFVRAIIIQLSPSFDLSLYIKQFGRMSIKTCCYWRSAMLNMNLVTWKVISVFSQRTAFLPTASKYTSQANIHIHTGFYNYRRVKVSTFYRKMCPDRLRIYGIFHTRRVTASHLSANKHIHIYIKLTYMCQSTNLHVSSI